MTKIEINDRLLGYIVAFLPDLVSLCLLCLQNMNDINNANLSILKLANNLRSFKLETLGHNEIRGPTNFDELSSEIVLQKILNVIGFLNNLEQLTFKRNYPFFIGKLFYENFIKIRSNVKLALLTDRDEYIHI